MAKKYYAVKEGRHPGIYTSWEDCKKEVMGFSGAVYKSFLREEDAETFLLGEKCKVQKKDPVLQVETPDEVIAYVDGSYSKELKKYAYGCVLFAKGQMVELSGAGEEEEYLSMNNVAGEILGSTKAIQWAIDQGFGAICIYHDYEGIARWAKEEWKANKTGTKNYREFIKEAEKHIRIRFVKVAAHTGVEYNERADFLAKSALNGNES